MSTSLTLFFYKRIIVRKIRKLRRKQTSWYADDQYNKALEDVLRIILEE